MNNFGNTNNISLFVYLLISAFIACKIISEVKNDKYNFIVHYVVIWLVVTFLYFQYQYLYESNCFMCSISGSQCTDCQVVDHFESDLDNTNTTVVIDDNHKVEGNNIVYDPQCKSDVTDKEYDRLVKDREMKEKLYNRRVGQDLRERAIETKGFGDSFQTPGDKSEKNYLPQKDRITHAEVFNDMVYTDHNHLPMASGYKSTEYEYGYSYIPPEKWYPQPVRPPICVTDRPLKAIPTLSEGSANLMEFYSANRITGPSQASSNYIYDRTNSGR